MNGIDQPEERNKSMPKDDASSIEILSEGGRSDWSIYSASRGSIAGSDEGSMDFQKVSILSKMATIVHQDGRQFIEQRDLEDSGLPYSAEFYVGDELWKLNGEDCLLISPRRYISKVSVEGTVDLDEAISFEEALRMLLKQLKVVNVLLDEQLEECKEAKRALEMILDRLKDGIDQERDVIILRMLFKKHGNSLDENFKNNLINCLDLSSEIESALDNYVTKFYTLVKRNDVLGQLNNSSLSFEFIDDAIQEAMNAHRARFVAICPSILMDKLQQLSDDHIMFVSTNDMNLFSDLKALNHALFEVAMPTIFSKYLASVQEINEEQIVDPNPQPNHIFLHVCKSLQEIAEQLRVATKTDNLIIYSEDLGWKVANLQEESKTPYSKCLKQQLTMLAAFANHFEPGGPFRKHSFPYKFKLFKDLDPIPESVRIWLCLLDHCMTDLVQADADKMNMLSCFFRSFVSFIASEDFNGETLDCLRTITHDVLRSLAGMQSSFQPKRIASDTVSLKCSDDISRCLDKFPRQHFGDECDQIEATLRRIFIQDLSVESTACCDAFNQLLKDIADLTLEWFVKLPPSENRNLLFQGQFIIAVDSIWKDTEYQCFKVVDPEAFVKLYKVLYKGDEIPKHYQLKVIQVLLDQLATKQSLIAENDTSDARIDMTNSIRKTIRLLKEQPEYSCFELFLKRMSESFSQSNKKKSIVDCRNQMSPTIQSPATDPPQTDRIDADESLDPLFNLFEGSISKGFLVNGLQQFKTQFDKYIAESDHLSPESRIERIVSDVVLNVKPQLATTWTEEFKRNELPKVLAGLSAVWSLIVSQNGSSLEKLMKPSSMQIGCILSLFGDQILNDDDLYRLLYISKQQGRELVIGLTAALLALYGHTVQIACYNSNLTRRNVHLIELFKSFSNHSSISFGSVEDIARERSSEVYDKYATYIHNCIGEPYSSPKKPPKDGRSVLLIDDIDILLQCRTLGQTFKRYVRPTIPGLDLVQEKLFSMKDYDSQLKSLNWFIRHSRNPQLGRFRDFLAHTQKYTLYKGSRFHSTEYTNQRLFNAFLSKYLTGLPKIDLSHNFRLSSDGVLVVKNYDEYDEQDPHYTCLEYFKLKGSCFQQTVNGYKNYGYMSLGCIAYPYARMLKSFPLVLGFASSPLDGYEDITLRDHYNIHHQIAKRNPLPMVPTEFDSKKHFLCVDSDYEWDWMMSIMVAINAAIGKIRSVLVFFKSEVEMKQFQSDFALHLKHLCVTTIETASKGENCTKDKIAADEVTVLAIDAVDHDNGRLAENREVHVIQTFWSCDGKEEKLIRRQAERSHGGGSYELILLRNQLPVPEPNKKGQVSYDLLDGLREKRCYGKAMFYLKLHEEYYEDFQSILNNLL